MIARYMGGWPPHEDPPIWRMVELNNSFHRLIIAMERLEAFLEFQRRGDDAVMLATTAMNGPRDFHDDQQNPPTLNFVLREVPLHCSALFFQTKFDDDEMFKKTMTYFMTDLLEWYGGRNKDIPYDEVEKFALLILVSLSRQVDSVLEIMQVCKDYVTVLPDLANFSDEEERKAVVEGFISFIKTRRPVEQQENPDSLVSLSKHRRGAANDGYRRLMDAMLKHHDTPLPAKKVRDTFTAFVERLPEFSDEMIEEAIQEQQKGKEP